MKTINVTIEIKIRVDGQGFRAETKCGRFKGWGWTEDQAIEDLQREVVANA